MSELFSLKGKEICMKLFIVGNIFIILLMAFLAFLIKHFKHKQKPTEYLCASLSISTIHRLFCFVCALNFSLVPYCFKARHTHYFIHQYIIMYLKDKDYF